VNTIRPSDSSIVRIKNSDKALAVTTDCNSAYVYADPYKGAMIAVSEAARNIVCSGGKPVAITNCLNFGNPYDPEVFWQFANAIKGMGDACIRFNTPVTGGNVSFYNQSNIANKNVPVYPTPTIGMLGILDNVDDVIFQNFQKEDQWIYLLGKNRDDIGSSEYLRHIHNVEHSPAPYFDLDEEFELHKVLATLNEQKLLTAAHDISEGGLFFTLLEMSYSDNIGFEMSLKNNDIRTDALFFGECQSRVIVTINDSNASEFENILSKRNFPFTHLGQTLSDNKIIINGVDFDTVQSWKTIYNDTLENILKTSSIIDIV
jgi:phosphoribosylformylglycinamidine synthase